MQYNFIPLILVLVSLATIIIVIVRKFPQLSVLDVENLPEVREEKKKNEFLQKRAMQKSAGAAKAVAVKMIPFIRWWKEFQLAFRKYVGKIERTVVKHEAEKREQATPQERQELHDELRSLLYDASHAATVGDYEAAEKKYIAAIRIDTKNVEAYRGLGDVYLTQQQFDEALETYQFLLQLEPENDTVMVKLAELSEQKGEIEKAISYYQQAIIINPHLSNRFAKAAELLLQIQQYPTALDAIKEAVDLEPQNPKYLDMLTEISILVGDKALAQDAYDRLRMVNPENQKLDILKDKIKQLTINN